MNPRYIIGAPTMNQVRKIHFGEVQQIIPSFLIDKVNQSNMTITLITGAEILHVGLDAPARAEGFSIDGALWDEVDNVKRSAWANHIFPTFADRKAWSIWIGVPEGLAQLYEFSLNALKDPENWAFFTWPSSEVIPKDELDRFRAIMDEHTFNVEFNAQFLNYSGRVYYAFDRENYKHELFYNPNKEISFVFDYNTSPGVAAIIQEQEMPGQYEIMKTHEGDIKIPVIGTGVIGEVHIPRHSNTLMVCRKLYEDWQMHKGLIKCYGDAAGGNNTASAVQGSDWDLIKNFFAQTPFRDRISYHYPRANPRIKSRVNAMNARIRSIDGVIRFMVDAAAAPHVVEDFERLTVLEGSNGEIDKKSNPLIGHVSDGISYRECYLYPVDDMNIAQTFDL